VWSLDTAPYVVFDLETTGLRPGTSRICEIGAVRLRGLVPAGSFTTLVDPRVPLPRNIAALTGLADEALRTAPAVGDAVERFLAFAGNCVLVAHNARFDLAFLHREVERLTGQRLAAPVLDTVWLARRLLAGRTPRASLASLAHFFGTSVTPCHRALPDAQATAEILVRLIGIAQEQGASTIEDLCQLAAPRARRIHGKRSLAFGAPTRPGVYLFRDRTEQVLYVGRARDLRARLRSYFRSERQRPAVEAALGAAHRIEWRVFGSELEAALEELRLIRELRPPANARGPRPERYVYFERRGDRVIVSSRPTELGPIKGRSRAARAARALAGASDAELDGLTGEGPLPRLRARLRDLSESLRYEEAARLRDRIAALESVIHELARLERLRAAELCLLVPAREAGFRRLFVVAGGRIAATRTLPAGGGLTLELDAALAEARVAGPSTAADDADELLLLGTFLKRPPPELTIIPSTAVTREAKRLSAVPALA
jgi:DNA polymerase-3 subunit epsilon